jgi:hypothetical protein
MSKKKNNPTPRMLRVTAGQKFLDSFRKKIEPYGMAKRLQEESNVPYSIIIDLYNTGKATPETISKVKDGLKKLKAA